MACWYKIEEGKLTKHFHFGDEYDQLALQRDIENVDFVVAHNAKFEAQWLKRSGIDISNVLFYCTMVCEWVLLGNNPHRLPLNLDDLGDRRGAGRKDELGKNLIKKWGVDPVDTPRSWLVKYCFQDVEVTHNVFLQQHNELEESGLWHIALARNLVVPVLADIELAGLEIDAERVEEEYKKQLEIRESIAESLDEITGGINLNSRPQVARLLYETLGFEEPLDISGNPIRTGKGGRSTSDEAILRLKVETDDQNRFINNYKEYVKASTLISKSLDFLYKCVRHTSSRFFGRIVQGRTQTHRLASLGVPFVFPGDKKESRIQLQNIPRQFKKLFTAHREGWVVMEGDGAQLEFRVAGDLGTDRQIEEDLEKGVDIHALTRDTMIEWKHPDFEGLDMKEARQEAKAKSFQPLYGGRGQHKAENAYADAWAKKYQGITSVQEEWCLQVANNKQLTTPYGMKFYWPDASLYRNGRLNKRTEVFNFPVQGFATGEIIPIALVYFWHRTKDLRVEVFNTVHDSIILRLHEDDVEEVKQIMKVSLTTDVYKFLKEVYNYEFRIPLGAGVKVSKHWGDSDTEEVWEVWPDGRERYTLRD